MEKYGVACSCASGNPDLAGMVKVADGLRRCPTCGAEHQVGEMKLKSEIEVKDRSLSPGKPEEPKP